jgi:hypothetical protein
MSKGIYQQLSDYWRLPLVEVRKPKPGFRHQTEVRLVQHRFPVRGGITPRDAIVYGMSRPPPILKALRPE